VNVDSNFGSPAGHDDAASRETAQMNTTTTEHADDQLLRVRDVVRLTTVSRTALWKMRKAGAFVRPVILCPGRLAFRKSEVLRWMAERPQAKA
jgi:prophage regulatory protein